MRLTRPLAAAHLAALLIALPAAAQNRSGDWMEQCERNWGGSRSARHCEERETRMAATPLLTVDGGPNGSVTVRGWDEAGIVVRARVQAHARSEAEARALAARVRVDARGGSVSATGPESREGRSWSVSYEVLVPRRTGLEVETRNGGISVEEVAGSMQLRARNGGVALLSVGGAVRARTDNGPLRVVLSGPRWTGAGLDAETRNGPVTITLPRGYSASLETGTANGPMNIDIPITVRGRLPRHVRTELGGGGAPIRAVTTNGPVTVRES
ncbi:MAG TPA: hypothetical protein VE913_20550 [Longimicrobium sp.]|nr:hypothetical protein [Longimicrobium sp.]